MPAPELRLVLAVSLDGRLAPPSGGAAQIGGPGDRRVLEEALAWADACLIGGRTLRLHGSSCLIRQLDLLEQRSRQGLPPQPAAVVVSRSGSFDPSLRFFSQPLQRWLLGPERLEPPAGFHVALPLETWHQALAALAARGLQRLVLLGGAELAVICCSTSWWMNCNSPSARCCSVDPTPGCRHRWPSSRALGRCRSSALWRAKS